MSSPDQKSSWAKGEAYVETPELDGMPDEEVAFDWVRQVLNLPVTVLDTHPRILSETGQGLVGQIRVRHAAKYKGQPWYDPEAKGADLVASFDREELARREAELESEIRAITDIDTGVMAKNRFLAMLADQFDGTASSKGIVSELEDVASNQGHVLGDEEKEGLAGLVHPFAKLRSAPTLNLLVSLRRYAEGVGNNYTIYKDQFLGLYAVYNAGQEAVHSSMDS
jgi:hypothetical protein